MGFGSHAPIDLSRRMGFLMRRLLPSRAEVIVFAVLAILFAVFVSFFRSGANDLGFAAMAGPVFLIAACMGLRRSPAWMAAEETEDVE